MPAQQPAHLAGSESSNKSTTAKKNTKERPLTAAEVAFINNTEAPPLPAGMPDESMNSILLSLIRQIIVLTESYYTKDKFLSSFGICPNTVKKWMNEKGLPYIQVDGIILFKKTDVDAFFMRFRQGAK